MASDTKAFYLQNGSRPTCYVHPYLFTHDSDSVPNVSVWSCTKSAEPALCVQLEGEILGPVQHYLISPGRILTRNSLNYTDYQMDELIIHDISSGAKLDCISIKPDHVSIAGGKHPLIGVLDGSMVVWKEGSGEFSDGSVEIYRLSDKGKFVLVNTLQPPADMPALELATRPGVYEIPQFLHLTHEAFVGLSFHNDFPISFHLTRWSSDSSLAKHTTFDFMDPNLPYEWDTMHATLKDRILIPQPIQL